jgi:hypothetical protein
MCTSDVGEISLYMHMVQQVYVLVKQRAYGRWTGAQVRFSVLCNSIA